MNSTNPEPNTSSVSLPFKGKIFLFYLFMFFGLETTNYLCGNSLQKFHLEYMGHGSQEWRYQPGFWYFLLLFGIWLYPFSFYLLIASLKAHLDEAKQISIPSLNLLYFSLVALLFLRIIYLGVWTGIFGAPPYEQDPLFWIHPIHIWGRP